MEQEVKLIAYYLPQYYEIEFNNNYWGKGYTEWTTALDAKPLFKGHYQPHVPADLGFYNLLMPEARKAQADMAREYGIDGFCYWHYWFGGGKTIMEKPLQGVLECGEPDFPFCVCWANHSWVNPATKELMLEQQYLGEKDYESFFYSLLPAFRDSRYIRVDNRPVFVIYDPKGMPDVNAFMIQWKALANKEGLDGIYFIGIAQTENALSELISLNLDAINIVRLKDFLDHQNPYKERLKYMFGKSHDYKYSEAAKYFVAEKDRDDKILPTIIPGWDHSPRNGYNSLVLTDYTPDEFRKHLVNVFSLLKEKQNKLCFVKAWNEWGEGNHLEPDLRWGKAFLEVLKKVKEKYCK